MIGPKPAFPFFDPQRGHLPIAHFRISPPAPPVARSSLLSAMSDANTLVFQPLQQFFKNSVHLVKKCTKPDRKGAFLAPSAAR